MTSVKIRSEMNSKLGLAIVSVFIVGLVGCQSAVQQAVRDTKYSAYEMIGVQKRDLLKREVKATREEQAEASEEFKDALEKLKAVYAFDGGEVEKSYRQLNSAYADAESQATEVRTRIQRVETTAGDLFQEWDKEIDQMKTASLKTQSRRTLTQTQTRYHEMITSLKRAEATMNPVLSKMKDQVLFLKHNLNAKAIGSLRGEGVVIERDIERLLQEMNMAIAAADRFIEESNTLK